MDKRLAFIGGGNIAQAILSGLVPTFEDPRTIIVADPSEEQGLQCKALGATWTQDNAAAVADADVVLLCVKPQLMETVVSALSGQLANKLIISVAAGITAGQLSTWCGLDNVIRSMPNTPALVGQGMLGLYAAPSVSDADRALADELLSTVGVTRWFADEHDLDAVTAVSGSGPAYFFYLMEAMIDSAQSLGLSAEAAQELVTQTALGAAAMANQQSANPAALRAQVTSPNGTTHAACEQLRLGGFEDLVDRALRAARDRSIELSAP